MFQPAHNERGLGMMVDHSAKVYMQLHNRRVEAHVSVAQATKIESLAARMYGDDINLCRGALSEPHQHFRPGQRDDAMTRPFVEKTPVI